jgi:hypothetical protein
MTSGSPQDEKLAGRNYLFNEVTTVKLAILN